MQRVIWLLALGTGFYCITMLLQAAEVWATVTALPGAGHFCNGTLVGDVPVNRFPMCSALWFIEAKSWAIYIRDTLINVPSSGINHHELLRTMDVAVFVVGFTGLGITLAIMWANLMTKLVYFIAIASQESVRSLVYSMGPAIQAMRRG